MTRIPIGQQINEVRREIAMRNAVYPGLVARGKMSKADQTLAMDRMAAVLTTLEWLAENESAIRAWIKHMKAAAA